MSSFGRLGPEFDDFVRAHSSALLRTAFLLTNDRGQAEDLLQVTLLRTASHWGAAQHNPTSYARRVLVNLARNRWRDLARRPRVVQNLEGIDPAAPCADDATEHFDTIAELVAQLPPNQRRLLVLRYFEDLSVAEVAAILNCREGSVKSGTSRALARLRELHAARTPNENVEDLEHHYVQR